MPHADLPSPAGFRRAKLRAMKDPGLQRALAAAGGVAALARALGITKGAVSQWRRLPADRIGAVASFHGGGLVNDNAGPNSPHLLAAATKASFLIAIAENDDKQRPNDKTILKETFDKAKLSA